MKKGFQITIIFIALIVLFFFAKLFISNSKISKNNENLEISIKNLTQKRVNLNNITPFSWDTLYTFEPYTSKEEMENIIGFESNFIKENSINEGVLNLLFVKDKKVVANIIGYPANLGFNMEIPPKINSIDNPIFEVSKNNGIIKLKYIKGEGNLILHL